MNYSYENGGRGDYRMRGGWGRDEMMSRGSRFDERGWERGGDGERWSRGPMQMQRGRYEEESESHAAPLVKVLELIAESDRGWEDAAQRAVWEASRSVRNIKSVYIKDMTATVTNGRITHYRCVAKVSFAVEV